jgi:N-acyl amino acid synthase of PEP-CTERM/exosortase system
MLSGGNMKYHTVKLQHNDDRITDIYRLRYKVYCDERGFEKPEDHPGGIEVDEYDEHSAHFATIIQGNDAVVGTARIIFNTIKGFPLEKHANIEQELFADINRNAIGEVSRLAFSKEYCKRLKENALSSFYGYGDENGQTMEVAVKKNTDGDIAISIYSSIYKECREKKLTHLIAIMTDGLYRLLKRNGISFKQIGPSVDYHGKRTPYICCVENLMRIMRDKHPDNYGRFVSE